MTKDSKDAEAQVPAASGKTEDDGKTSAVDPAALTPQERNETFQKGPSDWGQEQGSQQQGNKRPMETEWQQPQVNRPVGEPEKGRQEPAAEKVTPTEVQDEL